MPGHRKLGRATDHRVMMLRNLTTDFFRHGHIITSEAKAKELAKTAAKVITLAKRGDLHARRQVAAFINDKVIVQRLFDEIAPDYADRSGGYTRIYKLGPRRGDAAMLAKIELV